MVLLNIQLAISFLIGRKNIVNFPNQRHQAADYTIIMSNDQRHQAADYTIIMSRTLNATGNYVTYDYGA